jgi:FMN phosphatase YigB (HAD superfamily)
MINCIAIDLDDTLIYFPDNFRGMLQIFRRYGIYAKDVNSFANNLVWIEGFCLTRLVEKLQEKHPQLLGQPNLLSELETWLKNNLTAYSDTRKYLPLWQNQVPVVVVTAGKKCFQSHKVQLLKLPVTDIMVAKTPRDKPSIIKEILKNFEKIAFIDDSADNLDSVRKCFPEVLTIQIRRPNLVKERYTDDHLYAVDLATVDAIIFPETKKTS